jgi:AhpD family alkylhydroperoxidase
MRFLEKYYGEFTKKLDEIDELYAKNRCLDEKTYQLVCFALSIKGRSKPCVRKHFKGAMAAGASRAEIADIFALTMRESAGADDCWTHDCISDYEEIIEGTADASCAK